MDFNKIKISRILKEAREGILSKATNKVSKEEYIILDVVKGCVMLSNKEYNSIKVETIEDLVKEYNIGEI